MFQRFTISLTKPKPIAQTTFRLVSVVINRRNSPRVLAQVGKWSVEQRLITRSRVMAQRQPKLSLPITKLRSINLRVLVVDHMEVYVRPSVMDYCVLPRSCTLHSLIYVTLEQNPTFVSSGKNVTYLA